MRKMLLGLFLMLGLSFTPAFGQSLAGSVDNVTVQAPPTYLCVPADQNGPAAVIPYTCTGFGTVLQTSTTFTLITATVDRPVIGSQQITVAIEDFTTGNNIASCAITAGQKTCSYSFSYAISAGDTLAAKIYNNISGPAYYNLSHIQWVMQ